MIRGFGASIMLVFLTAGPSAANEFALILASQPNDLKAIEYSQSLVARGSFRSLDDFSLLRSSNGWLAVTLGVFDKAQCETRLAEAKTRPGVPRDAYCSPTQRFTEKLAFVGGRLQTSSLNNLSATSNAAPPTVMAPPPPSERRSWRTLSPEFTRCADITLCRSNSSVGSLMQQRIEPDDPRLNSVMKFCESVTSLVARQDFECDLRTTSGATIRTRCYEEFVYVAPNGAKFPLTFDDIVNRRLENQTVSLLQTERSDAVDRRRALEQQKREEERQIAEQRAAEARQRAEAARLQAEAEALRKEEEVRLRKNEAVLRAAAEESEQRRIAAERDRVRSEIINQRAELLLATRRSCKPSSSPPGFLIASRNKTTALRALADENVSFSNAVKEIMPFAAFKGYADAEVALTKRIINEVVKWRIDPKTFNASEFHRVIDLLRQDCLFEQIDFLGTATISVAKMEFESILGISANAQVRRDVIDGLMHTNPMYLEYMIANQRDRVPLPTYQKEEDTQYKIALERQRLDEERQREDKLAASVAERKKRLSSFISSLDVSKQYFYPTRGACTNSPTTACITREEYEYLCTAAVGLTGDGMSYLRIFLATTRDQQALIRGGRLDSIRVSLVKNNSGVNNCLVIVEASGLVDGTSKRVVVQGLVNIFRVDESDKKVRVHGLSQW